MWRYCWAISVQMDRVQIAIYAIRFENFAFDFLKAANAEETTLKVWGQHATAMQIHIHLHGYRAIIKLGTAVYQHKITAKHLCLNSLKLQYKKLIWFHALWTKRTSLMLLRLKEVRKWLNTIALSHFDGDYIILEATVDDRGFCWNICAF